MISVCTWVGARWRRSAVRSRLAQAARYRACGGADDGRRRVPGLVERGDECSASPPAFHQADKCQVQLRKGQVRRKIRYIETAIFIFTSTCSLSLHTHTRESFTRHILSPPRLLKASTRPAPATCRSFYLRPPPSPCPMPPHLVPARADSLIPKSTSSSVRNGMAGLEAY